VTAQAAGNAVLIVAAVGAAACVAVYLRTRWWRNQAGPHLLAFMAVIAGLCLLGVLRLAFDIPGFAWVRLAALTSFAVVIWWRLILLVCDQEWPWTRHRPTEGAPMHPATTAILRYFEYDHLPPHLQAVSQPVCEVAHRMATELPEGPEVTAGLRKLLEAKDAFVRAALPPKE
jgi:hypothetical protein